jgi:hypothetical protein
LGFVGKIIVTPVVGGGAVTAGLVGPMVPTHEVPRQPNVGVTVGGVSVAGGAIVAVGAIVKVAVTEDVAEGVSEDGFIVAVGEVCAYSVAVEKLQRLSIQQ